MKLIYKGQIFRKNLHMSQKTLADLCGVSVNTISSIENYKFMPTFELAFKLAIHLHVYNVSNLFDIEDPVTDCYDYPAGCWLENYIDLN